MLRNFSDINIVISPDVLWGILSLFLIFFLAITLTLQHHWKYYGIKDNPKIFTKSIHWLISIILILIMTASILAYESYL